MISTIPCLKDNYSYLITCPETGQTAIVDASEGTPVLAGVRGLAQKPTAIWATHHHHDHVGGNEEVASSLGITKVYGYESDKGRIPLQSEFLTDGQRFTFGALRVTAIHIPGHTLGAVAYFVEHATMDPIVFTGDTLFVAGCGRLFEGTPEMMHRSLSKLRELPPSTRVYCGHEYTAKNLEFAAHIEPSNEDVRAAQMRTASTRAANKPTVPSTMAEEVRINPFLRTASAEIRKTLAIAEGADHASALGAIRKAKDNF